LPGYNAGQQGGKGEGMRAATYHQYGGPEVLRIEDVPPPPLADDTVRVRVRASSVTTADWRLRASAFPGITWLPGRLMIGLLGPRKPILGGDFAGEVEAVGPAVTRFAPGDRVFGFSGFGAHAELVAVPEASAIAAIPANLGFAEAASVPFGALAALVFLRDFARIVPGDRLLVIGASGGVGCHAVQLGRHLGAEVTGVASAGNLDLVAALGARHVIDYRNADPLAPGRQYDAILDVVGATTFARCRPVLAERGRFVPLNFGLREIVQSLVTSMRSGQRVVIGVNKDTRADLEVVADLLGRGALRPVVDCSYPLDRIAEAHRHVEGRHRRGSVVVTLEPAPAPEAPAARRVTVDARPRATSAAPP
jgi:NADPH:quinone reductase-like Zn-dependent oxidoreductase